jgi:hypothetical protein
MLPEAAHREASRRRTIQGGSLKQTGYIVRAGTVTQ